LFSEFSGQSITVISFCLLDSLSLSTGGSRGLEFLRVEYLKLLEYGLLVLGEHFYLLSDGLDSLEHCSLGGDENVHAKGVEDIFL